MLIDGDLPCIYATSYFTRTLPKLQNVYYKFNTQKSPNVTNAIIFVTNLIAFVKYLKLKNINHIQLIISNLNKCYKLYNICYKCASLN